MDVMRKRGHEDMGENHVLISTRMENVASEFLRIGIVGTFNVFS